MSDDASDELSDMVADHISETRSVRSMGSNIGRFIFSVFSNWTYFYSLRGLT